jgi:hypothetical protein
MFDKGFVQLGEDIYVYKNFVSKEELISISDYLKTLSDDDWYEDNKDIKWMLRTDNTKILEPIRDRIVNLSDKDMTIGSSTVFVKMKSGYSWGVHEDEYEFKDVIKKSKTYVEGEPFDLVDVSIYGIVIYFNEFEGGEIYYPEQNIEYKPAPGDMVIHGSGFNCRHGVKEILSDVRYSHSNHISRKIKIPKE